MADEQTPRSFDDAEQVPDVPTQPDFGPADAEAAARRVRQNRPVRRRTGAGSGSAPAAGADGAEPTSQGPQAGGDDHPAEPTPIPAAPSRPSAPRPVRRKPVAEPEAEAPGARPARTPAARPVRRAVAGDEVAKARRTTPAEFVRQSAAELRKVIWPTSTQLGNYFVVVLLFVLFIVAYVSLLDFALGWGLLKLLAK